MTPKAPSPALQDLDLNLLRVFDALRSERSVSAAARRLHITQSGASRAMARLRDALGDPLFVVANAGLTLTPYAERLAGAIQDALALLSIAIARRDFDPASSKRRFTLATTEYAQSVLLPPLLLRLREEAPGIWIDTLPSMSHSQNLPPETVDLYVSVSEADLPGCRVTKLLRDQLVMVVRIDHPASFHLRHVDKNLAELRQLFVSTGGVRLGRSSDALAEGAVAYVNSQSLLAAVLVVAESDSITALPRLVARRFERAFMLRSVAAPVDLEGFSLRMQWHERLHDDEGHRWLRKILREVAAQVEESGRQTTSDTSMTEPRSGHDWPS